MTTVRPTLTRALSAHSSNINQRPFSANTVTFSRKELIENVYTMQPHANKGRATSAKTLGTIAAAGIEKSKKIVVKQSKRREQMEEQILRLKKTVNGLTQQLLRQKGKTESIRKKGQKMSKILTSQFQNEAHWNSAHLGTHLVTGIKHAYDSLKERHQDLQEKYDLLLKQSKITREIQNLAYIDSLQAQNKALKQQLESLINMETPSSNEVAHFVIAELKTGHNKLVEKYNELSSRYHMCQETLKDRNRKLTFLEKLIIEKDNNIHNVHRENKRLRERLQNNNIQQSQGLAYSHFMEKS